MASSLTDTGSIATRLPVQYCPPLKPLFRRRPSVRGRLSLLISTEPTINDSPLPQNMIMPFKNAEQEAAHRVFLNWSVPRKVFQAICLLCFSVAAIDIPKTARAAINATTSTGWDIYSAPGIGNYRYGPSLHINSDGSIEMWSSGQGNWMYDSTFQTVGSNQTVQMTAGGTATVGQKFTASKAFYGVSVPICTWGTTSPAPALVLSLYQWNTDYTTTVNGAPLWTWRYASMTDGAYLLFPPAAPSPPGYFPAGTYLWIASNPENTVGVWKYPSSSLNTNYTNGSVSSGDYMAQIQYCYWDSIRHSRSTNGGVTFGSETETLVPDLLSHDHYSNCDPGVVHFDSGEGGYYYIGYTSIENINWSRNELYVARSRNTTGPWEKWDGSGWVGEPESFIKDTHADPYIDYGLGEPSFVVVGTTLYIYYSNVSRDSNGKPVQETLVATASTTNPNWPGSVTLQGVAFAKRNLDNSDFGDDSADVKYIDAYSKFYAIHTVNRFSPKAYLQAWESADGLTFHPSNISRSNLQPYLHNCGLSGTPSGHLNTSAGNFASYAYGSVWAYWNTALTPLVFSNDNLPAAPRIFTLKPENGSVRFEFQTDSIATSYQLSYGTSPGSHPTTVTGITASPYTVTGLTNGMKYYFILKAVSANGTSSYSEELSAMPQNYSEIMMSSAAARSCLSPAISGWDTSNVIDGNMATNYSSVGWTDSHHAEWVYVDTGAFNKIGRIIITSRQPTLYGRPNYHAILGDWGEIAVSNDNQTWFPIQNYHLNQYTITDNDGNVKNVIDFPRAIGGRYIRLYEQDLRRDQYDNYYLQLAEFQAQSVPVSTISSASPYLSPDWILDLDTSSIYSSALRTSSGYTEYVGINLGSAQTVTGINITPRAGGLCFPVNFTLESSSNGSTWSTISGQSYTSYPNPGGTVQAFNFSSPVTAQYFRINASTLSSDGIGNYALQLASFNIKQEINFTTTASSTISAPWAATNVQDGYSGTLWSSNSYAPSTNGVVTGEWIKFDLGASYTVKSLRLLPRNDTKSCFPYKFSIQASTDNSTWTTVQNYTSYNDPAEPGVAPIPVQLFYFNVPVTARYIKVVATQLTADSNGNYMFQLADVFIEQ